MAIAELKSSLAAFATFARSLQGDEKSEAQSFLDHFFRALGHPSAIAAGATFEFRIAKKPGSSQLELLKGESAAKAKGGKKYGDLVWPERVLIEMKSRGENLEKHYDQLFDYWTHIVPRKPAYAILCNFDEFWIYDFNIQLFDPVDRVLLRELAESSSAFNFLLPEPTKPIFENNRVEVTRRAADGMGRLFRDLVFRGEDRARTQRFILQLLVAMVAEDIGLLPENIVTALLEECAERGGSSYDLLGGLFRQMATEEPARAGRYQGVRYFNGGLFLEVAPIEFKRPEAYALHDAARHHDWSKVKPEIFGTLFQQSMETGEDGQGRDERHAFGAHFTSEFDIQKVVGPTIVRPWRERIAAAGKNLGKLRETLRGLRLFRVLDPACGSGNFLFVAYREIKRLERTLLLTMRDAGEKPERLATGILLTNFFGLDVVPFAVELAKVTLMLAKELELREAAKFEAADGLHLPERPLPLDNLNQQIVCADALFADWPKADVIIGNPPYLDARKVRLEHGADYVKKMRRAFPTIPGRADFCVHWFRKAHDSLSERTPQLPCSGRAGLVGTNTIRQNYSRVGGLDYIVSSGGTIVEAVGTEVWSGDAQVHVSIVNWLKGPITEAERTTPKKLMIQRGDSIDSPWETYEFSRINAALSTGVDVTMAVQLRANSQSTGCFEGQQPGHDGFRLSAAERSELLALEPKAREIVHPYINGDELIGGEYLSDPRFIIDFWTRDTFAAREYPITLDLVRSRVLGDWKKNAAKENTESGVESGEHQNRLKTWWQLKRKRKKMIDTIARLPRYIACVRHTKRPIFEFLSADIHPDSALTVFPLADDYSFGILQSPIHFLWFTERCSTIKADFRYTSDTVFDTFPWPQAPTKGEIVEVAAAAVALRALRREKMAQPPGYSLRALYRTLEEPGANPLRAAHARLDTAVRAAYAMRKPPTHLRFSLR